MSEYNYNNLLKRVQENTSTEKIDDDRFKLPKAEIFYEGNTTVVKNFDKICDMLSREPQIILKFLLGGLGTAGEFDGSRVVFQGKLPARSIQDKIKEYIDAFVMCSECGRPDTHLVKQGRTMLIRCDACGAFRSVKSRKKKTSVATPFEALKEGNTYDVIIKDIGRKGDGVAYIDKYIIYVPGAVKGAGVKVKIQKISGTVAFGEVVEA